MSGRIVDPDTNPGNALDWSRYLGEFRMSSGPQVAATLDDLYRVEGKAELIGGGIVPIMPTGRLPNLVAVRILRSLAAHVDVLGRGEAFTDNMGFAVPELSSGRQ